MTMWNEPSLITMVLEQRIGRKVAMEYLDELFKDCPTCHKSPEWGHNDGCLVKRWIDKQARQSETGDSNNTDTYETEIGDLSVTVTIEKKSGTGDDNDQ